MPVLEGDLKTWGSRFGFTILGVFLAVRNASGNKYLGPGDAIYPEFDGQ